MSGPRGNRRGIATGALAGWLFADLILVIMIVAMGSQADPLIANQIRASATASRRPSAPPTTAPPTAVGPRSVEHDPFTFYVTGPSDNTASLTAQIEAALGPHAGEQAGFVQTFGWGESSSSDTAYSTAVNALLQRLEPAIFPSGTVMQDYIYLSPSTDKAEVDIYFYTTAAS